MNSSVGVPLHLCNHCGKLSQDKNKCQFCNKKIDLGYGALDRTGANRDLIARQRLYEESGCRFVDPVFGRCKKVGTMSANTHGNYWFCREHFQGSY